MIELEQQYNSENSLQKRLKDFKKALQKNQTLEEFDREIFESIVEKVIIGGYDENGKEDPYKIIFIYKTGLMCVVTITRIQIFYLACNIGTQFSIHSP